MQGLFRHWNWGRLSVRGPARGEEMETQTDSVMTIDELAVYLKTAKSTLYKVIQEDRLPGRKVGRQWRFLREAVDAWLSHSQSPTGDDPK